ncbi:MAG: TonB-dependent receptor [Ichthyobacteriaceae bacterium]|nr:TonB-dependent receptor [Ichthyobacteriaceae bacterium]
MKKLLLVVVFVALRLSAFAQETSIEGHISSQGERLSFVNVVIKSLGIGVTTNANGKYHIELKPGKYTIESSFIGYRTESKRIVISKDQHLHLDFEMRPDLFGLDQVVVTSTRNEVSRKESAIVVNVLSERIFEATQATTMSQGLNFTPGLRVEMNCANCGLPEVKMNGLAGAYSQILIDGKASYSALSGVYGLEQIPANMIERIEVVKGGGSALYGANAIAGTINVITKDPTENTFTLGNTTSLIAGKTLDNNVTFNSSTISDDYNSGVSFFGSYRNRDFFDVNNDGFSELSEINTISFGAKAYYKPSNLSRVGLELHFIDDYRRGGNMFDKPAHQTDVTEQTQHDIVSGQLSYEIYNKNMKDKYSTYLSFQTTHRDSYYGGGGNTDNLNDQLLAASYYGNSDDILLTVGGQYAHNFDNSTFTSGLEIRHNNVVDMMPGYNRKIDQTVNNLGIYAQYEFKPIEKIKLLFGGRYDYNPINGVFDYGDFVDENNLEMSEFTPRASILYNVSDDDQIRLTVAQGFRPPQAFDEDLHIETIGGAAKIVRMSPDLKVETSNSATLGYEKSADIWGSSFNFAIDGFYTKLNNPFVNVPSFVKDPTIPDNVILVEKRNGSGATVFGSNIEVSAYFSDKLNMQMGMTFQKSEYDDEEVIVEGEDEKGNEVSVSTKTMPKSPNSYGYFSLQYLPFEDFSANFTGVYTGKGIIASQTYLQIKETTDFFELGIKLSYDLHISNSMKLQMNAGAQNIFNQYQTDLEIGKDRDVGYIYGPSQPRTYYLGLKIGVF